MISMAILTVGKLKEKYWRDAVQEYSKRLSSYANLTIHEVADVPDGKGDERIKAMEGERLLALLHERDYVIVLDRLGKQMTSEGFAKHLDELSSFHSGRIVFVIGGSIGLHDRVLQKAHQTLSFSQFTFAHQLMRVILLEQIYRAFRIQTGAPYHK